MIVPPRTRHALARLARLSRRRAGARAGRHQQGRCAAAVKASFINDLETLRTKFVGLAEAFPQDKYTLAADGGCPVGVRSADARGVRRLQLHPDSFGAKGADLGTP